MPPDASRVGLRRPTIRSMSSVLTADDTEIAEKTMLERTVGMMYRAQEGKPLTDSELDDVLNSLHNISPKDANIDWDGLRQLLSEVAHLSHKDWTRTGNNSEKLAGMLTPNGMSVDARQMLERIMHEGNWEGAEQHAAATNHAGYQPWAVLVTGVNGIRKTTSMHQPWFPQLLAEALVVPPGMRSDFPTQVLPCGENSFFRQLDHMITTLCNEDFMQLYSLTGSQMRDSDETPPKDLVHKYSDLKAAIFSRYRTLSELLGVLLLREAQKVNINTMCETSGRDVAMFHYIDHFFPKGYNKLALHFTVNDLSCAQQSVDARMVKEIKVGQEALVSGDVVQVIYANAGGPYGSEVLPGVQADSDRVWNDIVLKGDTVGQDWYKATIAINAHPTKPWTAQAVLPDGSRGTLFTFEPLSNS